jgi:MoaD family protein
LRVRFYAGLRPVVGQNTVDVSLPEGATIQQLVDELVQRWPALRPYVLTNEGELSRQVNIVVDGRSIRYLADGLATRLSSEQEIAFFPALAGGSRLRQGSTPGASRGDNDKSLLRSVQK